MPVASVEVIPSGFRGTEATVQKMHELTFRGMTDLTIQKIADRIITSGGACRDRDYGCKAKKLFNFVKSYVRFERDPFGVEMVQDPLVTLKRRAGDCDDHSILIASFAGALGFPYAFKTIKADSARPEEFSHIYTVLHIPGKGWTPVDTSVSYSYFGWEAPGKFESRVWNPSMA